MASSEEDNKVKTDEVLSNVEEAIEVMVPEVDPATVEGEGYLVKVITKPLPSELKAFGPFEHIHQAQMLAAHIESGALGLTIELLPSAIENVFVEPVKMEKGEQN